MEPIYEPDDVDLVISGGCWSAEVVAEVAEFFRNCETEVPMLAPDDATFRDRKNSVTPHVIPPVVPGT